MICSKCGAQNIDGVTFCGSCGVPMGSQIPRTPQQSFQNEGVNYQQQPQPQYQQQPPYSADGNPASAGTPYSGGMIPPKNYMVESIVVTVVFLLCCCSPISVILGIIAIFKANSVNSEFERGNIDEAISNSESAKKLSLWAIIAAVISYIVFVIVYFLFIAAIVSSAGGLESFLENITNT